MTTLDPTTATRHGRPPLSDRDADVVLDALDRLADTGPEFDGHLSNHGPMAVDALVHLGGAPAVAGWVDAYRRRLMPRPPADRPIEPSEWREHLGDLRRVGDWVQLLEQEADENGWRALVATWWPRLLPGAAAGGAHGIIRSAHAVRMLAEAPTPHRLLVHELASGLGYWAARYQPIPGSPSMDGCQDSAAAVATLPRLAPEVASVGPGLAGRLGALTSLDDFAPALDQWGAGAGDPLDEIVSTAALVLANRNDGQIAFCHAVTAPAAIQMVVDELPDRLRRPSIATGWQVAAALFAAFGAAAPPNELTPIPATDPGPEPDELAARAIEHGDEHVIKLTEAAVRQFARTGDRVLLVAADRYRRRTEGR